MPKNNIYLPKENLAKVEIVQELKDEYKVPSFEEFMKGYEGDSNLNYDDLKGSDIGSSKGYGPIGEYWREWTDENGGHNIACGSYAQRVDGRDCACARDNSRFCLEIKCHSWCGHGEIKHAGSASQALQYAHDLEDNNWHEATKISNEVLHKCATLVREAVRHYDRGNRVKGYVKVKGRFWTNCDWSIDY